MRARSRIAGTNRFGTEGLSAASHDNVVAAPVEELWAERDPSLFRRQDMSPA